MGSRSTARVAIIMPWRVWLRETNSKSPDPISRLIMSVPAVVNKFAPLPPSPPNAPPGHSALVQDIPPDNLP